MEFKKGDKVTNAFILIDEIVYYVEPCNYYDDGMRKIFKFIDMDNNVYVWKTSKCLEIEYTNSKGVECVELADIGDLVTITGTVKDIGSFRGEDQVSLTRCKVEHIEHNFIEEKEVTHIKRNIQLKKFDDYEIKTVSYRDYKNDYQKYDTLVDSFVRNDDGCFIDVIIA